MVALDIPVIFSGPGSYSAAPIERLFAFVKHSNLYDELTMSLEVESDDEIIGKKKS